MRPLAVGLLAVILGLVAAPTAIPGSRPFERAMVLERQGKFEAAFAGLQAAKHLSKAEARHRAHLGAAIQARSAATVYWDLEDFSRARSVLSSQQKVLDPLADALIGVWLARQLARVDLADASAKDEQSTKERADADAQARATLAKAGALERKKKYDKAAAAFKSVASQPATVVSAKIRQSAALQQIRAETAAATKPEKSGGAKFFDSVWDIVRDALKWVLIILLVAAICGGLWALRGWRRRRPEVDATTLSLTDMSGEAKDRNQRSYALTRELRDAIDDASAPAERETAAEIEVRRDLDGTPAPLVRISDLPQSFEAVASASTTITIGPIGLNPVQLAYLVGAWLSKPGEFEMVGALRTDGKFAELIVERTPHGAAHPDHRWKGEATGDNARREAIGEVATKIAVDLNRSYVSTDWRSFKLYRDAIAGLEAAQKLDAEARGKGLEDVAGLLTRALDQDPLNVLARFRLAAVLRALGRNADAARQFEIVREDVVDPAGLPPAVREFVTRQPELCYAAVYNRATAISKLPSDDRFAAGIELAALVAKLGHRDPPGLSKRDRKKAAALLADPKLKWPSTELSKGSEQRLFVLSYAAWASTLLSTVDFDEPADDERRLRLRERRAVVLKELRGVSDSVRATAGSDYSLRAATRQAQAILDNTRARVLYREQLYAAARYAAQRALAVLPDLGDASITLASIAMAPPNRHGDWVDEARSNLDRALRISPKDPRALFLLGELLVRPDVADDEGARAQFIKLPGNYFARFRLGEIAIRADDLPSAVADLALSQSQKPSADYRATLLVDSVIRMNENGTAPKSGVLDEAIRAATRVRDAATSPDDREAAVKVIGQLEKIRKP